jgi:large subunit ribosomal protein L2
MLKKQVACTNSLRHQINFKKNLLLKNNYLLKNLFNLKKFNVGRSSQTGHITVRHKGGGCKKKLHLLSSDKCFFGIIIAQMYSACHNTFISIVFNLLTRTFFKVRSTSNTYPGSLIISTENLNEFYLGYKSSLTNFPVGSIFHSLMNNNKISYSTSAGNFCQLLEKRIDQKLCKIRLPSGKIIWINKNNIATLGIVNNSIYKSISIGKAGRNRLKGKRPSVRGIAMNPVDHPHGGRTNGGMPSVTPWGIPTKGKPTVKKKNYE